MKFDLALFISVHYIKEVNEMINPIFYTFIRPDGQASIHPPFRGDGKALLT